jgi:putative membrane protein
MLVAAKNPSPQAFAFHAHPAVWLLMAGIIGGYLYVVRVLGPAALGEGKAAVTRRQKIYFVCGVALLWFASDWPMHELSDSYLYSAHMLQHMLMSYFAPPLLLLAVPEWFGRLLLGRGKAYRVFRTMSKPVLISVLFNAWLVFTHIPGMVNVATSNVLVHYLMHTVLMLTSLLMWIPICGPFPEMRLSAGGKMAFLFIQSIVPTVPAGWLTFADGIVYKTYDHAVRVWGVTARDDQQLAGVIMKAGGSFYLWTIVTVLFFKRFMAGKEWNEQQTFRKVADIPLTYEDVRAELEHPSSPNRP